jgi:hypothetical protein
MRSARADAGIVESARIPYFYADPHTDGQDKLPEMERRTCKFL